jgi:hypothetical protein
LPASSRMAACVAASRSGKDIHGWTTVEFSRRGPPSRRGWASRRPGRGPRPCVPDSLRSRKRLLYAVLIMIPSLWHDGSAEASLVRTARRVHCDPPRLDSELFTILIHAASSTALIIYVAENIPESASAAR